jgi:hypothetical protein
MSCVFNTGGIHHVCLEVCDVRRSLQALTPAGVRVLDPEPKIGAHGNPVRQQQLKQGCSVGSSDQACLEAAVAVLNIDALACMRPLTVQDLAHVAKTNCW